MDSLLKYNDKLEYGYIENIFHGEDILKSRFNINPELQNLPPAEQDFRIRSSLLGWKIEQLQWMLSDYNTSEKTPLILRLWFWIWSSVIWASSVVFSQVLKFAADRHIIQKLWNV